MNAYTINLILVNNVFQSLILFRSNKDKESLTSQPPISSDGVYNIENTQVTFNPKNFKILYVINSENCFYRKLALTRAKHVSSISKHVQ